MAVEGLHVTRREPEAMGSAGARHTRVVSTPQRRDVCCTRASDTPLSSLSSAERSLLRSLVSGQHLRADRTLDGGKAFRLHDARTGPQMEVAADVVQRLCTAGLVASNLKFPRAAYLLTAAGMRIAAQLADSPLRPLVARTS